MEAIGQAVRAHAIPRGIRPSLLMGIADHESGVNPNAKNPASTAAGAFQCLKGTANDTEPGSYDKILGGDIETQARVAAKLFYSLRQQIGYDDGAVGAWWVGAAGFRKVSAGIVLSYSAHPKIDLADVQAYIANVKARATKFTYLDSPAELA